MPKAKTMNRGASLRSTVILAKLRRDRPGMGLLVQTYIDSLADWVKDADTRAGKRPGGLGPK